MRRAREKAQNSSYLVALLLFPLAAALPCDGSAETNTAKSNQVIDGPDQRLMDAETALLQSLQARAMAKPLAVSAAAATGANSPGVATTASKADTSKATPSKNDSPPLGQPAEIAAANRPETANALATTKTEKKEPGVAVPNSAKPNAEKAAPEQKQSAPGIPAGEAAALKNSNANLRRELQSAQARIDALERSLDQSRSQLTLAETELTRLSNRLDSKNRQNLGKYNLPIAAAANPLHEERAALRRPQESSGSPRVSEVRPPAPNVDLQVATVSVDKADLRLGPGKNHSALMAVPRGSRLVVETRQGEWYRVFAPSGERAWINSGMVLFGDGGSVLNDGTAARVRGFNPSDEEEAFRRVQRITAGQ